MGFNSGFKGLIPYNTAWFKKIDSISYICISWTIQGMWMIYVTFESGDPKFSNNTARLVHSHAAASVESKIATMKDKIFSVRKFIKTESATAVQRAFRLRFNIQPPTRKIICRWNHQFEQRGCLCPSFWITLYLRKFNTKNYQYLPLFFANWHSPATLTEVLRRFFPSCKANARVYLAKTGHGPHFS